MSSRTRSRPCAVRARRCLPRAITSIGFSYSRGETGWFGHSEFGAVGRQRKIRRKMRDSLRDAIFGLGPHIRYVAFGDGQRVETVQRDGIADASDANSDFFEELLVNPTLLTLARQRGDLDCGGLRHVIVGYGNFNQVVVPTHSGHVSVCVAREANAAVVARDVAELLKRS